MVAPVAAMAQGMILQPAGDAALANLIVGSSVSPDGTIGHTVDLYLVRSDGSQIRRLTTLDPLNQAPGASAVAISPDGTRAAYIAIPISGGAQEVHAIDIASGGDRLIATNLKNCVLLNPYLPPPSSYGCLSALNFSQDGSKLIWQFQNGIADGGQIMVGNFDGSGVRALAFRGATWSGSARGTTADGRLIFVTYDGCGGGACVGVATASLDGSGLTSLVASQNFAFNSFSDPVISADGSQYAYVCNGLYHPGLSTPYAGVAELGGGCFPQDLASDNPSSLTLPANGSQVDWVAQGQINTYTGTGLGFVPLSHFVSLSPFDVQMSSDGSLLLFGAGPVGGQREAVWMSDGNAGNEHPVFPPRYINPGGVVGIGSAAGDSLPLSPGSYFTIYGVNLGNVDAVVTASSLPFQDTLANVVSVAVNGTAVPVQAVTPWQINAILPQSFATGPATVTAGFADGTTVTQAVTVARSAAAISTFIPYPFSFGPSPDAAAFHAGTAIPADSMNPASPGEILETYGFGLGATTPAVADGAAAPLNPPAITSFPAVSIGPVFANVTFAGLVPGLVGVYQVNVVVPALAAGAYELRWATIDPASGPAGYIWVN
jgi:uncharacterized protein (TIGR03437 family)